MNNKNRPPIQYTKLSSKDIAIHKNCYIDLLLETTKRPSGEWALELSKAMQLFHKTFK